MPLKLFRRKSGGNYWVRGTIAGCHIYESTGLDQRRLAEAWAHRRETQILERHALGEAATLTFAEAALDYLTAGKSARFLDPLLEHFGPDTRLVDIDNQSLRAAATILYPGRAPGTINRQVIAPVSAVCNHAADQGKAQARRFTRLKEGQGRTRWLSPSEFEGLLKAAAPHLRPILAWLIGTGCRSGEALKAEARDFYPDTGEAWVQETKNGHPRMVRMPGRALDIILAAGLPDQGPILLTPKGQPYVIRKDGGGQFQTAFNQARDDAGLGPDVTPHVLRHTWATWFYAQTKDFGQMLDLGGWRTTDTAEKYRKMAPANLGQILHRHGWDYTRMAELLPTAEDRRRELRSVQ